MCQFSELDVNQEPPLPSRPPMDGDEERALEENEPPPHAKESTHPLTKAASNFGRGKIRIITSK